ncbi:rhamnulokinase [Microbacterium sp.]|uniref:rhamnulokinase n=1 Tax=Microbacterium sp. TaxID=51671 RepID=UPI003F9CB725
MTITIPEQASAQPRAYAAVDLGASSGRVILGVVDGESLHTHELHRFANTAQELRRGTVWDLPALFEETLIGLERCARWCEDFEAEFAGIGVDSWGVDWAYLSPDGELDLPASHYRGAADPGDVIAKRKLSPKRVYELSGIADQPINSALRMSREARKQDRAGQTPLFVPDVWLYWLAGAVGTDATIASTSQLLDARSAEFSPELVAAVGLGKLALPPVDPVGSRAGETTPTVTARLGLARPVQVFRVAGHDTACAFAFAEPGTSDALISSGTWSLVGMSSAEPLVADDARRLGLTNERGATAVLSMRNLTGLWMLQECAREWSYEDGPELESLIAAANALPFDARTFDATDERLFARGDMERRIRELCAENDRPLDETPASVVRAIFDSLAATYVRSIGLISQVSGKQFHRIRIVGGGSRNSALCQLTADLSGLPVVAGPVEASAIGNIALQALADGAVSEITDVYRALVAQDTVQTFTPSTLESHA